MQRKKSAARTRTTVPRSRDSGLMRSSNRALGTAPARIRRVGEASLNLSDALLAAGFNQDTCQAFGSGQWLSSFFGPVDRPGIEGLHRAGPFHASTCASPSITTALSNSAGNDGATLRGLAMPSGKLTSANGGMPISRDVTFDNPGEPTIDRSCTRAIRIAAGDEHVNRRAVWNCAAARFRHE